MKKITRCVLLIAVAVIFVVSAALVVRQLYHYHAANKAYEEALAAAIQNVEPTPELTPEPIPELTPEPTPEAVPTPTPKPTPEPLEENAQFLMDLELENLRETSQRVLGWIYVPDSEINYPLLMVSDNNEYLRRTWDGTPNSAGCIFLECRNQRDLSDFNTLIYGHYMRNGTMFGSLLYYKEAEYLDSHPFIYIVTDESVRRYEVFSTYEADVTSDTYRLYFEDDARKQSVLDYYIDSTTVDTGIFPTVEDHILTLSTCTGTGTYDTHWVVQARLDAEFSRAAE